MPTEPARAGRAYAATAAVGAALLLLSMTASNSLMEVGKALVILGAGGLVFIRRPVVPARDPIFWIWILWLASIALSFACTADAGNGHRGTWRALPVWTSLLLLGALPAAAGWTRLPWRALLALPALVAVLSAGSLWHRDGGRSHGFIFHPVVYGQLLAAALVTALSIAARATDFRRRGWAFWVPVAGAALAAPLALVDLQRNDSRSSILMLALPALLAAAVWSLGRIRRLLLIPLLLVLAVALIPRSLVDKFAYHLWIAETDADPVRWLPLERQADGSWRGRVVLPQIGGVPVAASPADWTRGLKVEGEIFYGELWLHEPLRFERLGPDGAELSFRLPAPGRPADNTAMLSLRDDEDSFWRGLQRAAGRARGDHNGVVYGLARGEVLAVDRRHLIGHGFAALTDALRTVPIHRIRIRFFEDGRSAIWASSRALVKERPWTGFGPGNWAWAAYQPALNPWYGKLEFEAVRDTAKPFHSHSNFWTLAVEAGLPAALAWLALCLSLMATSTVALLRQRATLARLGGRRSAASDALRGRFWGRFAALMLFAATFAGGLYDTTVFGIAGHPHWLAAGLLTAYAWSDRRKTTSLAYA